MEGSVTSDAFCEDRTTKTCNTVEKCSDSTFRTVAELSLGGENLSGLSNLDMVCNCLCRMFVLY